MQNGGRHAYNVGPLFIAVSPAAATGPQIAAAGPCQSSRSRFPHGGAPRVGGLTHQVAPRHPRLHNRSHTTETAPKTIGGLLEWRAALETVPDGNNWRLILGLARGKRPSGEESSRPGYELGKLIDVAERKAMIRPTSSFWSGTTRSRTRNNKLIGVQRFVAVVNIHCAVCSELNYAHFKQDSDMFSRTHAG